MNSFAASKCIVCQDNYGSKERKGMCTVCFKNSNFTTEKKDNYDDFVENKNEEIIKKEEKSIKKEENTIINKVEEKVSDKPKQSNIFNCHKCNKMVGYTGFKCQCGYIFCGTHRHFTEHNCEFDFKAHDKEKLLKKNPVAERKVK